MVAGLLYLIGLVMVLITIAIVGYQAPSAVAAFNAAMAAEGADLLEAVVLTSRRFTWALVPLISGLGLMGFGRIIMLLGSINRSLRSQYRA